MSRRALMLGLVALLASAVVAVRSAGTTSDRTITQRSIGGARLGLPRQAYVAIFGRPVRVGQLEGGLTQLFFPRLRVSVYLRGYLPNPGPGVAINTYGRAFRTSAGVGPCSPARALRAAYGDRLRKR